MKISSIKEGGKLNLISCSKGIFNDETYTKYSLLKYKSSLYLLYAGIHITRDSLMSINKIQEINSGIETDGITMSIPNNIEIGFFIKGKLDNNFNFFINNIISIEEGKIDEKEEEILKRGN